MRPRMAAASPLLLMLVFVAAGCAGAPARGPGGGSTTVIVVRHAERATDDPADPGLSAAGRARAQALREAVSGAGVTAVYATQYRRTRDTGAPIAAERGIEVAVRPIDSSNADTHADDLAREIATRHPGGTVVVVGHSNTVPELVAALGGGEVEPLPESEYDRMYVLVVGRSGAVRRIAATFGAPTD
ncbi:MAG TPA: histidine phosphatase family protein [Longimicrobiaceae bacterium]